MKKILLPLTIILAFSLIMSACAAAATPAPTPTQDTGQVATMVAQTVDAIEAQKAAQAIATTPPLMIPTLPGQPTLASVLVPTLALPPIATTQACNVAVLVSETVPDGTSFVISAPFTKTWTLQNMGTCTWNTNYKLAFSSGDTMSGPKTLNFGSAVAPGSTINLSLSLLANSTVSTTTGYWGLYDDKNIYWGRVWVTINSVAYVPPSVAFSITHVETTETTDSGKCTFHAAVTATAAGTMTFYWTYTAGATMDTATRSADFASAGTISLGFLAPTGTTQAYLFIVSPNNQGFGPGPGVTGGPCT